MSLNTVRTHTKNIYAKLGVNNRRAAVRRAAELDLLREPRALTRRVTADRRSKITTAITTCGDARSPLRSYFRVTPATEREHRRDTTERMSGRPTPIGPRPDATRSASRATSMPAGPPGSTA